MEQLTQAWANSSGRMMEVRMITRKVRLELSRDQLDSFMWMVRIFLVHYPIIELKAKAHFLRVMNFYEKKLRSKQLSQKAKIGLSFDFSTADSLMEMLDYMFYQEMGVYEKTLRGHLYGQLDHQTS